MRQVKALSFIVIVCILYFSCAIASAEDGESGWKSELKTDKQEIASEKQEMKEDAGEARAEEKQLRSEMVEAESSGDKAKAAKIREQLKDMHAKNIQEMRQDKRELKDAKKEMRRDVKDARKDMRMHHGQKGAK
ncbi:MAG: hypothetical protein Q7S30_01950 [Candidatus Omnitrophota bacterium]|nr:hypothetical protein [Candidatus Omnitrophota bacterium]